MVMVKKRRVAVPQPVEIPNVDTIVFLMGLTKLDIIVSSLKKCWMEQ